MDIDSAKCIEDPEVMGRGLGPKSKEWNTQHENPWKGLRGVWGVTADDHKQNHQSKMSGGIMLSRLQWSIKKVD